MKLKITIKLRRKREVFFAPNNQRVEIHSKDLKAFWKECRKFGFRKVTIIVDPGGVLCIYATSEAQYSRYIKNLI